MDRRNKGLSNEVSVIIKDEDIISIKRLGKKGNVRNVDIKEDGVVVGQKEEPVHRAILISLNETVKPKLMKSLYKLQDSTTEYKHMTVKHDMTKEERAKEKQLKEDAKKLQAEDKSENFCMWSGAHHGKG